MEKDVCIQTGTHQQRLTCDETLAWGKVRAAIGSAVRSQSCHRQRVGESRILGCCIIVNLTNWDRCRKGVQL